jgi:ubiquitin
MATTFQIQIKALTGKTITADVSNETTIKELKAMIHAKDGIEVDEQRLIFSSKQLEDPKTIGDYGITADSTISLVLRLSGGLSNMCR